MIAAAHPANAPVIAHPKPLWTEKATTIITTAAAIRANWMIPTVLLITPLLSRCQRYSFATWPKESSTGVSRPKMETITFNRD